MKRKKEEEREKLNLEIINLKKEIEETKKKKEN